MMVGKRVRFDDETWHAINLLARDSMKDFQDLAERSVPRSAQEARPSDRSEISLAAERTASAGQ
jgi:hypothetical protein